MRISWRLPEITSARPARRRVANRSLAAFDTTLSFPAARIRSGLAQVGRVARIFDPLHDSKAAFVQATVGEPSASSGALCTIEDARS